MNSPEKLRQLKEEASLWAARLEGGNLGAADQGALRNWLQMDPSHWAALSQYRDLSKTLEPNLPDLFDSIDVRASVRRRKRKRLMASVFSTAAAIAVTFAIFSGSETIKTHVGERHVTTLSDGSKIEMNANTAVSIKMEQHERRVKLIRGEALFTVSKNPSRPFFVDTQNGEVRVTGTVFDVRTAGDRTVDVTVVEGTVNVSQPARNHEARSLTANDFGQLESSGITVKTLPPGIAEQALAWREGAVIFNDTPLYEVVERFAAYRGGESVTLDPSVRNIRVGGRYPLDDFSGMLRSLETILPIRVVRNGDGGVHLSAR